MQNCFYGLDSDFKYHHCISSHGKTKHWLYVLHCSIAKYSIHNKNPPAQLYYNSNLCHTFLLQPKTLYKGRFFIFSFEFPWLKQHTWNQEHWVSYFVGVVVVVGKERKYSKSLGADLFFSVCVHSDSWHSPFLYPQVLCRLQKGLSCRDPVLGKVFTSRACTACLFTCSDTLLIQNVVNSNTL